MTIEIDISQVPADKQQRPDFIELRGQMQAALSNSKWIGAFCIHEAGHKIYLSRLGVTEFKYIGPRIIYNGQQGTLDGYPVAVKAEPKPLTADGFDFKDWLSKIAQAKAAGGVFSRTLTAAPDNGDSEDKDSFKSACDMLRAKMPSLEIDEEALWKEAQEIVAKELRSPKFRQECWKEANEIRQKLFGA
jgi:hypothetical protein